MKQLDERMTAEAWGRWNAPVLLSHAVPRVDPDQARGVEDGDWLVLVLPVLVATLGQILALSYFILTFGSPS